LVFWPNGKQQEHPSKQFFYLFSETVLVVEWGFIQPALKVRSACQYVAEFMTFWDPPNNKNNKFRTFLVKMLQKSRKGAGTQI